MADYQRANGGIIVPTPNAPTGILLGLEEIEKLATLNTGSVVVIDEAYIDFGGESAVALIDRLPNLLVIQTFSKSRALAGLRVGVAMGAAPLIEGLERVKNSFNSYPLDVVAQKAALASLKDEAWFRDTCAKIVRNREQLSVGLQRLGFTVLPSAANFVLARHPRAASLFKQLRDRGIIVRYFDKPRIDDCLRISVGTWAECEALLVALEALLSQAAGRE